MATIMTISPMAGAKIEPPASAVPGLPEKKDCHRMAGGKMTSYRSTASKDHTYEKNKEAISMQIERTGECDTAVREKQASTSSPDRRLERDIAERAPQSPVTPRSSSKKAHKNEKEGRKGTPWTEAEHVAFLDGLQVLGKGNWRGISKKFVPTRTPTQVASHAQKHFLRVTGATKRKSRFTALEEAFKSGSNKSGNSSPESKGLGGCNNQNGNDMTVIGSNVNTIQTGNVAHCAVQGQMFPSVTFPNAGSMEEQLGLGLCSPNPYLLYLQSIGALPTLKSATVDPLLLQQMGNNLQMGATPQFLYNFMQAMTAARQLPAGEVESPSMTKSKSAPNLNVLPGGESNIANLVLQSSQMTEPKSNFVYRPVATRPVQNVKNEPVNKHILSLTRQAKSSLTHVQSAPSLHAMTIVNSLQNNTEMKAEAEKQVE